MNAISQFNARTEDHSSRDQHVETLRQLAVLHMLKGSFETAEKLISIAVWMDPSDVRSRIIRSRALAKSGQPALAVRQLLEARKLDPNEVGLNDWIEIGLSFARIGDSKHAHLLLRRDNHKFTN